MIVVVRGVDRRYGLTPWAAEQRAGLVNVKLKWVKDRTLDRVVARDRHLRAALTILARLFSFHPIIPPSSVEAFLRRYPSLFHESDSSCFRPTDGAFALRDQELQLYASPDIQSDLVNRLRRLLMLTHDRSLPLAAFKQMAWDLGFPQSSPSDSDSVSFLSRSHPHHFQLDHDGLLLRLLSWDPNLAVSQLQLHNKDTAGGLAFPVSFTRGYGLRKKCASWLREWQTLPYTSPYHAHTHLDRRTDVYEKRNVAMFHELLHLTIAKKTERSNLSNLRTPLCLPYKFTKLFARHPGIFYISNKLATHTIVLREAYMPGNPPLQHPILTLRESYAALMRDDRRNRRNKT